MKFIERASFFERWGCIGGKNWSASQLSVFFVVFILLASFKCVQLCLKPSNDWWTIEMRTRMLRKRMINTGGGWSCNFCVGILCADKLTGGTFLQILPHSFSELTAVRQQRDLPVIICCISDCSVYIFNASFRRRNIQLDHMVHIWLQWRGRCRLS